ncbi:hypothetical protein NPX13_g6052 [Xylaria arbuscula]|uniref:FAD-binding PCMH-type domain-containing protein n=1 Tax=Xylaria arbuscula TaxID=114810 RepID=A0A9W8NCJ5_9PEZI|nr:hypothetical protein NPX13_g6052 [Xylaria arbuscula]
MSVLLRTYITKLDQPWSPKDHKGFDKIRVAMQGPSYQPTNDATDYSKVSAIGARLLATMSWARVFTLGALLVLPGTHGMPRKSQVCKNIPGDPGWPSSSDWDSLNKTVDGRLISTRQLATVCHGTEYDEEQCQSLKEAWPYAGVHVAESAEFLMPFKQNQSCDPFTSVERPCELGNYAQYSIEVSSAGDIQAGIKFAKENNIRLTIKNTGHDLLGKSTGKGSLSLWTHGMNTIDFIDHYKGGSCYKGPAVKIGAGVLTSDIVKAASSKGYRVVTGTCPDVGVAGGYASGGGHGVFTRGRASHCDSHEKF